MQQCFFMFKSPPFVRQLPPGSPSYLLTLHVSVYYYLASLQRHQCSLCTAHKL